jgi:hypothetical protein
MAFGNKNRFCYQMHTSQSNENKKSHTFQQFVDMTRDLLCAIGSACHLPKAFAESYLLKIIY